MQIHQSISIKYISLLNTIHQFLFTQKKGRTKDQLNPSIQNYKDTLDANYYLRILIKK